MVDKKFVPIPEGWTAGLEKEAAPAPSTRFRSMKEKFKEKWNRRIEERKEFKKMKDTVKAAAVKEMRTKAAAAQGRAAAYRQVHPLRWAAQKLQPEPKAAWGRSGSGAHRPIPFINQRGPGYQDVDVVGRNLQQFEPQVHQHANPVNFGQQPQRASQQIPKKRRPFNAGDYL